MAPLFSSRHFCFTFNNPGAADLVTLFTIKPEVRYAIWQLEKGESGTPHYQGYIELVKTCRVSSMAKLIPRAHFEVRRGTREEAREYCRKDEGRLAGPWEYGTWTGGQGARTDLSKLRELLLAGMTEKEISDEDFELWFRTYKGIREWMLLHPTERTERTQFHAFIGDTGTGKSSLCKELSPNAFWKPSGPWFDGYNGQEDIVLDEADKQGLPLGSFLTLADRFNLKVPVKGGFQDFVAKKIFATSNLPLDQWFPAADGVEMKAFLRRVDSITKFKWVEEGGVRVVKREKEVFMLDWETRINTEVVLPTPPPETDEITVDLSQDTNIPPSSTEALADLPSEVRGETTNASVQVRKPKRKRNS
jgi:hypothetical protein